MLVDQPLARMSCVRAEPNGRRPGGVIVGFVLAIAAGLSWAGAAAAQNEISLENQLPGHPASEWDVSGAGDASIQGFATDMSVAPGETVSFKVETDATDYRLDVYRMGWYGGLGARRVATVEPSATLPQAQVACLTEPATGLVDCGNWNVSATWEVPANAVSGIYFAKLVREDPEDGRASHIVFVVRDDVGQSKLLLQTGDTTWQAYNSYGGNSLYTGAPAGRAYKVSYNRPFTSRAATPEDWVFNAEYPLVRWLERNGYDVSYTTGIDSDRRGAEILEHEVFISVGHDEYWSADQRANVTAARDAGVNLAFLSGNEVFWKTRWEPSIDGSATSHRTLVSYKETHANAKIDPTPEWTGTWRDARAFNPEGPQPENALTGQIFTVNCCADAIRVPEADGKLRFWRNTDIATLAVGQTATLPAGTLGYEWDEDLDNGFRPAGSMRLSTTTVNVPQYIQDYGSTYAPGTATHHLTLYRAASGALVFGAGSIQWVWGLDEMHDRGNEPPDPRIQQAMVNLFADMDVQPETLQVELAAAIASTDTTPPTSAIASPLDGASVAGLVTISGSAADIGGGVVGGVEVSTDGGATWHPANGRESWSYSFTPTALGPLALRSRAVDDSGQLETPGPGITVTAVPPDCPCSLWSDSTTPAVDVSGDTNAAELGMRFRSDADGFVTALRFYRSPASTGPHSARLWTNGGTLLAEVPFTSLTASGWQQQALPAPVPISANTTYVVSYHTQSQYAFSQALLASGIDNPPLHALADGVDGANGVYAYGAAGTFPTQTYNASHYWVDVVFDDALPSYTGFDDATTPPNPAANDGQPIELGVKFRSEVPGVVRALRFYKGALNTGVHVGQLYGAGGALLGEATFTDETESGWQEVELSPPVAIAANTTYVAAYHSSSGYFAFQAGGLAAGIDRRPLSLLANGVDGGNAVYLYTATPSFPASSSNNGANYFVDLRFQPDAPFDGDPPAQSALSPLNGALNVLLGANVSATFDEALDPTSITGASFELRDAGNAVVPATVGYVGATRIATLTPSAPLQPSTVYSARLLGGPGGIRDLAGNPLAADVTWSFTTAGAPLPPPDEGPGGPILVIGNAADPFGRYTAEILRTEGLNTFTATDISALDAPLLAAHRVVVLAPMAVSPAQVTLLSDFVEAGGQLIAIRPDPLLAPLLGLTGPSGTLWNAYLQIDTAQAPGVGLVSQTMQFHGPADLWSLDGATALATLYSDATTATPNPAVTLRSVGTNGGSAAAFAYDLNRSIVYTRQGNPAWAGQERDGIAPIRANDLFYGAAAGDPQPDWVDLSKVAIPQADEQQRLLAGLIREQIGFPLPRFWYFPRLHKAVVILTGDNHGCCGGTTGRFANNLAADPPSCSVADWECVRSSSYIYPGGGLSDAQGQSYTAQGFELGVHVDTGCSNWTPATLEGYFQGQLSTFASQFPSLPAPSTNRTHCIVWSDWSSAASTELDHGIRLDTNYYYWPPGWVANQPGFFTGSGMPMRFAAQDGSFIDAYQAVTQMTDESGQSYPSTVDTLLDRALGAEGYYGAFTANMHTDGGSEGLASSIVASAQARGVPVVSGRQMLEWLDGRNASSLGNFQWNGSVLGFDVSQDPAARNLRALLPATRGTAQLASIVRGATPVPFTLETLRGIQYAVFAAETGSHTATYAADTLPPVISGVAAAPQLDGSASISWTTDEPATSLVRYGIDPENLALQVSSPALTQSHQLALPGLAASTTYYYRVTSTDLAANPASEPAVPNAPASFTTPAAICAADDLRAEFAAGSPGVGAVVVEDGDGDGGVALQGAVNESFDGATLPAGWSQTPWPSGGTAQVAGGALVVDGALAATDAFFAPGRSVEFVATFGAQTFQHVGLATDLNGVPWALVGTSNTTTTLFARTADAGNVDTPLPGVALGVPHRFRIEWSAASTLYYVDGVLVATHAGIAANLRPVVSDYNAGGASLSVAWLLSSPYPASASFDSRVFDASQGSSWSASYWTAAQPAGTSAAISVRAGNTPVPNASWSAFVPIASQGDSAGVVGRYAQYRAVLSTSDGAATPLLEDVSLSCTPAGEVCGNGLVEAPEECDDGGTLAGDGCSATCSFESPDADGDGIPNEHETNTGVYVSPTDTGSNPLDADSDDDGFSDGAEVAAGSNPNDAQSFPDGVAPVISAVTAIPQPGGTSAAITWSTDEPATSTVRYGTDPEDLSLEATSGTLVANHVLLLSDLQPSTTYWFRVTSIDGSSNSATAPAAPAQPAHFESGLLECGVDDLAADFAAGLRSATLRVRDADDGELALAATVAEDFEGEDVPTGWTQTPWQVGGSATVANGLITVDGTLVGTEAYSAPSRALEFVATFGAEAYQHVGFGTDLNSLPFILFSTGTSTTTLFARTWDAANVDTPLPGVALGVPHRFRIEWSAASTLFYVDGALVATHAGVATNLRPVMSDLTVGGAALTVDWLRLSPYAYSASFQSRIFDAGIESRWEDLSWTSQTPPGTLLQIYVRAGNTPAPGEDWTLFRRVDGAPPTPASVGGRYAQYGAFFSSSDPGQTPLLEDLTLRCAPQVPGCGNATIDPGEDCDDGGVLSGDGCSSVCTFESQDMDGDGILNDYETGTGVYVSPTDTGTDPLNPDSDGDGAEDGLEVASGSDPNDPGSLPLPPPVPLGGAGSLILLLAALTAMARFALRGATTGVSRR